MKLLSKTNRYYFIYTALLLACGGIAFFFIISSVIKDEVGEVLENELFEYLEKAVKDSSWLNFEKPIEFEISRTQDIAVKPDVMSDTLIRESGTGEQGNIPYLQLKAFRKIRGNTYQIVLRESLIESEGILFAVSLSMILLFITLLLGLLILNNYLSNVLWKPFYENLAKVRAYNVSELTPMEVVESDVKEFSELNSALVKMTSKIKKDYLNLKEFTENASHEIQTPLAIIKSNIDWLLQHVKEEKLLGDLIKIEMATNRISKTNHALLLLTKIENYHFTELENVSIESIVNQCMSEFEDFIDAKNLTVEYQKPNPPTQTLLNKTLVEILVNNLISNAVRHNKKGGFIKITLTQEQFTIQNSGNQIDIDPDKLFDRFAKANPSAESTGLGLAIIKQICDTLDYGVTYEHNDSIHKVIVILN